jgi:hypothetical protein
MVLREARRDRLEIGDFPGRAGAGHSVPPRLDAGRTMLKPIWYETVLPACVCARSEHYRAAARRSPNRKSRRGTPGFSERAISMGGFDHPYSKQHRGATVRTICRTSTTYRIKPLQSTPDISSLN